MPTFKEHFCIYHQAQFQCEGFTMKRVHQENVKDARVRSWCIVEGRKRYHRVFTRSKAEKTFAKLPAWKRHYASPTPQAVEKTVL